MGHVRCGVGGCMVGDMVRCLVGLNRVYMNSSSVSSHR